MSLPTFLKEALWEFGKAWPLKPHSDVLDAIFESQKMKALASFQDLYVGLEPYRNNELLGGGVLKSTAPAVFGLLAAIELHPSNSKSGGEFFACFLFIFAQYSFIAGLSNTVNIDSLRSRWGVSKCDKCPGTTRNRVGNYHSS
jgi:hypothetical protein